MEPTEPIKELLISLKSPDSRIQINIIGLVNLMNLATNQKDHTKGKSSTTP